MRAGHLIYKVADLDEGVRQWRENGFVVEYGTSKNPYNALIYFSEGPYIELLASTGMPKFVKGILKVMGKGELVKRFDDWDYGEERWSGFCIEREFGDLEREINFLKTHGRGGFHLKRGRRIDVQGRDLRYQCFFPSDMGLPFLMSYFNIDPKPLDFTHPNGVRRVGDIVYETDMDSAELVGKLMKDELVKIEITKGLDKEKQGNVKSVQFEYAK